MHLIFSCLNSSHHFFLSNLPSSSPFCSRFLSSHFISSLFSYHRFSYIESFLLLFHLDGLSPLVSSSLVSSPIFLSHFVSYLSLISSNSIPSCLVFLSFSLFTVILFSTFSLRSSDNSHFSYPVLFPCYEKLIPMVLSHCRSFSLSLSLLLSVCLHVSP